MTTTLTTSAYSSFRESSVVVNRGQSVHIRIVTTSGHEYERLYRIGDYAEHHSDVSFCHYGQITEISDNEITIKDHDGLHRVAIFNFAIKNYRFDLKQAEQYNLYQALNSSL